ncbi:hypothetical protein F5X96DRAFT_591788 [Biscogniauxia mediterranea]|nr:hypothetical protein F5X96DRAFT_591788 [Biscogniauxia mediterranea]
MEIKIVKPSSLNPKYCQGITFAYVKVTNIQLLSSPTHASSSMSPTKSLEPTRTSLSSHPTAITLSASPRGAPCCRCRCASTTAQRTRTAVRLRRRPRPEGLSTPILTRAPLRVRTTAAAVYLPLRAIQHRVARPEEQPPRVLAPLPARVEHLRQNRRVPLPPRRRRHVDPPYDGLELLLPPPYPPPAARRFRLPKKAQIIQLRTV